MSQNQPGSSLELVKLIKEVSVKEMSGEYCELLIYSIPHRLQAVIDARGGHTKY